MPSSLTTVAATASAAVIDTPAGDVSGGGIVVNNLPAEAVETSVTATIAEQNGVRSRPMSVAGSSLSSSSSSSSSSCQLGSLCTPESSPLSSRPSPARSEAAAPVSWGAGMTAVKAGIAIFSPRVGVNVAVAESKDERACIEEKVVDGRNYHDYKQNRYQPQHRFHDARDGDGKGSDTGEGRIGGESVGVGVSVGGKESGSVNGSGNEAVDRHSAASPARSLSFRMGPAENSYELSRSATATESVDPEEQQAPTAVSEARPVRAAHAAAVAMGPTDITRPREGMGSCEGDGEMESDDRGSAATARAAVPEGAINAETMVVAARDQPAPESGHVVRIAVGRGLLPVTLSTNAAISSIEGSPRFRFSAAFGGADGDGGDGLPAVTGRSVSSRGLGREARRGDYRIDSESVLDRQAAWGGFGHSASWRARMNHPLAWDPVAIPPPSTSTSDDDAGREIERGEETNFPFTRNPAMIPPRSMSASEHGTAPALGLEEGRERAGVGRMIPGVGDARYLTRRGAAVGFAREASPHESSASRPRLVGAVENEDRGDDEALTGEACFAAFNVSEDVTAAILGNLDARDLAQAAATSRGWKRCTSSRPLWRAIYARDFLGHVPPAATGAEGTNGKRNHGGDPVLPASSAVSIGGGTGGASEDLSPWSSLERFAATGHPQSYNPFSSSAGGRLFERSGATRRALGTGGGGGGRNSGGAGLFFWGGGGGGGGSSSSSSVFYSAPGSLVVSASAFEENPKEQYAKQLTERRTRMERQQRQDVMREARKRALRRRRRYERALDCLHVRLLPPLMGGSLALTLVFLAAWIDGDLERWGYWRVLSPMWIACGVAALAAATGVHAWRGRMVPASSMPSTFVGLRGAVRYFMSEVVQDQAIGIASGVALLFLLSLQLVMIGLRVEGMVEANWFVVFVPLLIFFLILCLSPCLHWTSWGDGGAYLLGMLLGWTPAVLCILLVCSRLEGDNVSMSVVMAPLWGVDLMLIVAPVVTAIAVAVRRMRQGEPVNAMFVQTLAASWCVLAPVLAPVVAFEIALAVYVEGERENLTAAEVFTPLIVWCCVLSLILFGYSCSYPPRHPEPPEGTFDHESPFAPTPNGLGTRLPRPRVSASAAGGSLGVGGGVGFGLGGGGIVGGGNIGVGGLGVSGAAAGVGVGGIAGRNRRRPLQFPPSSSMSPVSSSAAAAATAAGAGSNHPPPRPLTPAPHTNGMPPDMADVIALRSQLAELGMMAGFNTEPSSASPSLGGGRRGGALAGGTPALAFAERRVE